MKVNDILKKYNISEATLHNWKKLKYISSLNDISEEEIKNIIKNKNGIRRNKRNSTNNIIPYSYVSDKRVIFSVEKILEIKNNYNISNNEVLLEVILKLLNELKLEVPSSDLSILGKRSSNEDFIRDISNILIAYDEDNDFLGCLYTSLLSVGKKDTDGIFYTPYRVVSKIVDSIDFRGKRVLDPGCGSCNFLIQVYKKLKKQGVSSSEIINNIYGYDVDKIACLLGKINLYMLDKDIDFNSINIYTQDYLCTNIDEKFDIVIGNPPWGKKYTLTERKKIEKKYDEKFSKLDSFSQFIIRSFSLMNDKGILSFVLPSSLLNIKVHESIRQELLKYKIEYIKRIGREFEEIVTDVVIIKVIKTNGDNNICLYDDKKINQNIFLDNKYTSFLISDNLASSIIKKIKTCDYYHLDNKVIYALGIVTGNNKEYIKDTEVEGSEPIISGKELDKYNFDYKKICKYIVFDKEKLQQVANENHYRYKNKLLYRFIGKKLCFCVEKKGLLSLNSANVICLDEEYNPYYVSAILNSRITQLFFDENYDTHKVLRNHIESFYIPKMNDSDYNEIINICKKTKSISFYNEDIEKIIYKVLGLSMEEIFYLKGRYK